MKTFKKISSSIFSFYGFVTVGVVIMILIAEHKNNNLSAVILKTGEVVKAKTPAPFKPGMTVKLVRFKKPGDSRFSPWEARPIDPEMPTDTVMTNVCVENPDAWPDEDPVIEVTMQSCMALLKD